ncbi:ABC transporter ATP-binding protein [Agrobacterium sp. rho-13.3]|uniref:ABC transporter ATP-binding protein n=1 Tax=Agrobacterium sp. rho-13.3 TaxID=3072980 RepID=UPI002A181D8B|nr:ABC transporter ATP-binding protein [Agrobacterium sp. rho-13.3]MDX8306151.1 ABC transporter ATP-binding protein [Agrobacterium sp. rho-13.3]MDX8307518.1 ABC transporter ATP-binding protein [Agrobacterium sp. rho-13.3]
MTATPLLDVQNLRIRFETSSGKVVAVDDLSFSVQPGECLAIVGESGSGKSVTAMSILGLTAFNGGHIDHGILNFQRRNGTVVDLAKLSEPALEQIRGDEIAMIFQEPMTSLNPVFTVGEQIAEVVRQHRKVSAEEAAKRALELLHRVRIPEAETRYSQYPHELSGGMRQRIVIAMALACSPRLLIADEPTTALDVTVQAQILDLLQDLAKQSDMALLFITHDMGVVAQIADRVIVMRHGRKVEENRTETLFSEPAETYTHQLLNAVPKLGSMAAFSGPRQFGDETPDKAEAREAAKPLLTVKNLVTRFPVRKGALQRHVANVHAVEGVSFELGQGETLALVGESGCGKSTTGRSILRLVEPSSGEVELSGENILGLAGEKLRARRRDMQIVFQDPYAALDPRLTAFNQVAEPLVIHKVDHGSGLRDRVVWLMEQVGLSADHLDRYPHEFSGGQRQRLCIARALTLSPKIIIADEPVSALDVSIQAQVVNLMIELQQELGISYLFISHDIAVVERISHRVAVMCMGRIVEIGNRAEIFGNPQHSYTRALLSAVPNPDPAKRRTENVPLNILASPVHAVGHVPEVAVYRQVSTHHRVLMN